MASFVGALAVADLVKTTLGPKGMDKILQSVRVGRAARGVRPGPAALTARTRPWRATRQMSSGSVTVTNDGATILRSIHLDNPAAKILVDISKTQDEEVGDGTTSVVVLAGELLREAEKLIDQRVHPTTIVEGWRRAVQLAKDALAASATDNSVRDARRAWSARQLALTGPARRRATSTASARTCSTSRARRSPRSC